VEENSRLKKIIDMYVAEGANSKYLYEKMIKNLNEASREEREEGYKYLNCKLQESGKNVTTQKNSNFITLIFIVIFISASVIAIVLNYKTSKLNDNIKHCCEASNCFNEGTYLITRDNGKKEYYCYKHYKQMEDWAEMIIGY